MHSVIGVSSSSTRQDKLTSSASSPHRAVIVIKTPAATVHTFARKVSGTGDRPKAKEIDIKCDQRILLKLGQDY